MKKNISFEMRKWTILLYWTVFMVPYGCSNAPEEDIRTSLSPEKTESAKANNSAQSQNQIPDDSAKSSGDFQTQSSSNPPSDDPIAQKNPKDGKPPESANDQSDQNAQMTPRTLTTAEKQALCTSKELQLQMHTLSLPIANNGCPFETEDNGPAINGVYSARIRDDLQFNLPQNTLLCTLKMDSVGTFNYDDQLVLLLDEHVIVASRITALPDGIVPSSPLKWDFKSIMGQTIYPANNVNEQPYCAGSTSCKIPGSELVGTLNADFSSNILTSIPDQMDGKKTLSFIILGDNDMTDCSHTGLDLNVTAGFVNLNP